MKSFKPPSAVLRYRVALCLAILPGQCLLLASDIQSLDEFTLVSDPQSRLGSFNIVLNTGGGLSGNSAALAAFTRAANHWVSYFSDPIMAACHGAAARATIEQHYSITAMLANYTALYKHRMHSSCTSSATSQVCS